MFDTLNNGGLGKMDSVGDMEAFPGSENSGHRNIWPEIYRYMYERERSLKYATALLAVVLTMV